jgi:Protein of unknown function (DUF4232)
MAWTAALAVATAGLLTACGSTNASGAASPAATAHQTAQAGTRPAAAPKTALPGIAGLAVCQSSTLKVTMDTSQAGAAMGSAYYPVNVTNTSDAACGLYGYPGMSFVTSAGSGAAQIGAAAQRDAGVGTSSVRLSAGGAAHAWLQVGQAGNYPASTCQPAAAHWLRVFPPGDTVASYVDVSFSACSSASTPLLTVMPARSGSGVRGVTP